jgi:hypothetical protein
MDPLTTLGAAAASAQFLGYAVEGVLKTTKLIQNIQNAPDRIVQLLGQVEREVTAINRLLDPSSAVSTHPTATQYAQLSPFTIDARKALEGILQILRPLEASSETSGTRTSVSKGIKRLWRSILTVQTMKRIDTQLRTIQMLNTSLLRELHVSVFETQSLLR